MENEFALEITILKAFKGFRIKEVSAEMNARELGGSYLSLKRIAIYPLHNLYVFLKTLYTGKYGKASLYVDIIDIISINRWTE